MRTIFLFAAFSLLAACERQPAQPEQSGNEANNAVETPDIAVQGIDRRQAGRMAPETVFTDPDGGEVRLADFEGTPVLVNLWASWCAPCVKELPTLDALARSRRVDGDLMVIAVSQDNGPPASVRAFLDKAGAKYLAAYRDPDMGMSGALDAQVLPTSVLYDAHGREVWRYVGDLDWESDTAVKLLGEGAAVAN